MSTSATCVVCGEVVSADLQPEHLREQHRAPTCGFRFWMDGRQFFTMYPSMTVADVVKLTDTDASYQFFEQRKGGDVAFSHGNAIDLTREPSFYATPPATMWGAP